MSVEPIWDDAEGHVQAVTSDNKECKGWKMVFVESVTVAIIKN